MKTFRRDHISIEVDEQWKKETPTALLTQVATAVLRLEDAPDKEVTIVIGNTMQIQALNRVYRNVDAPTDVLSFSAREGEEDFVSAPEAENYLGDVIIAFPIAQRQASEHGISIAEELALLTIHGLLHLLGYDHATPKEEEIMFNRQKALLAQCITDANRKNEPTA